MLIYDHERERRILERRLEFLDILDNIVRRDIVLGVKTDPNSLEIRHISKEFAEVLNPSDVISAIKAIYEDRPETGLMPPVDRQ